jgi:poly(beta-D-mannuronate) C5 epimerase
MKMVCKKTLILAAAMTLLVDAATMKPGLFLPSPLLLLSSSVVVAYATTTDDDDDDDCVDYNSSFRTIEVTCDATFDQLEEDVDNISVLEDLGNREYLLSASIADQVRLTIASPAVTWVKISNEGSPEQYNIRVRGYMDMDGVKMTSWDPDDNSVVEQDPDDGSVPRPFIRYQDAEGGVIENSELAYIGYDGSIRRGFSVIGESANIEIRDSDFHHFWYAFYSNEARNITIDSSKFHDNHKYAIDPHTGTHDMSITNSLVYNNPGSGIICSLNCHNILIENNTVHDNGKNRINFSCNMHDSIVRNNTIYNSDKGITITESPNNGVYSNTIYNVSDGFYLTTPTASDDGLDGLTTENRIYNNTVRNANNGIKVGNSDGNIFENNTFENIESYEYLVSDGSEITIEDQHFTDDEISGGSGENTVTISNSGMITFDNDDSEDDNDDNDAYDTDNDFYTVELSDDETVTVKSIK